MQEILTYIFIAAAACFIILTFCRKIIGKNKCNQPEESDCSQCKEYDCKLRNTRVTKDNNQQKQ